MDVKSAFLNAKIDEELYIVQPQGFEWKGRVNLVYRLSKALYGLKQESRSLFKILQEYLYEVGFKNHMLIILSFLFKRGKQ